MGSPLRVAVACSGGRDSMALLLATVRVARALSDAQAQDAQEPTTIEVWALHVHHGLSDDADGWAQHVALSCRRWAHRGWPVQSMIRRVTVDKSSPQGIEAAARRMRYQALTAMAHELGIDLVLMGHHRQDQAETLLLQALRGGSLAGLAAMPASRRHDGIVWARPWLRQARCRIEAYGRIHGLSHVNDDSNTDPRFARNRLRMQVWPELTQAFAQAESSLADTAGRLADAQSVVQAWAQSVLPPEGCREWSLTDWMQWAPALRRQSLLHWLNREGSQSPTAGQLGRLVDDLTRLVAARSTGRWPALGLRLYRGVLHFEAVTPVEPAASFDWCWAHDGMSGAGWWRFAGAPGLWQVEPVSNGGLSAALLARLRPQSRQGGEQWQASPARPARSLKKQFQAAAVPAWMRQAPLLWAGDELVFVPGLGVSARHLAPADAPQWTVRWHPVTPKMSPQEASPSDHG